MLKASPENRDLPLDDEPYKTALETAAFLDGVPRYPKMHRAASFSRASLCTN